MICPKCRGSTEVRDSRQVDKIGGVRRRRSCLSTACDYTFHTLEVEIASNTTINGPVRIVAVRDLDAVIASAVKLGQV